MHVYYCIMYICTYLCLHIFVCICMCVCMCVCIFVSMYVFACISVYACVCICVYLYVCSCVYVQVCMHLHVYVYLYVCVYLHVCVYITENMTTLSSSCLLCGMWHLCQSMAFLICPSLLFEEPILLCPAPSNGAQGCWQTRRWGPGDTVSACGRWEIDAVFLSLLTLGQKSVSIKMLSL